MMGLGASELAILGVVALLLILGVAYMFGRHA